MLKKIIPLLLAAPLMAVETKIINENGYQSLWLWQLSNTALVDKEGIGLARESKKEFSTSSALWTMAPIRNQNTFAASEPARLFYLSNNIEQEIYRDTNKTLITALAELPDGFLAASAPDAQLLRFNRQNAVTETLSLSNTYLWDFVPRPGGGYDILASLPAQIYVYTNGVLSEPMDFPDEEHLVKGVYYQNALWVLSENALYKKTGDKITAVAAFNGVAANFVLHKGLFYVIQSVTTPPKTPEEKAQVISTLLEVSPQGAVRELFSLPSFYFTAVNAQDNIIYVGGDQWGLTISYDTIAQKPQYSALGTGKVLMILPSPQALQLLTTEESALWSLGTNLASQGEFISEIYDTGSLSQWGALTANVSVLPDTAVAFYAQTGVVKNTAYWSDWVPVLPNSKITAPEGRYIRYKAVLSSRSRNNSPTVYGVSFPYTQRNLPPRMEKISAERRGTGLHVQWSASDPNKDNLSYDVYLRDVGHNRVKITPTPITATNFIFPNESFSSGLKRISVVASDLPSNAPESALTSEISTQPLIFDSEAPVFGAFRTEKKDGKVLVAFTVSDNLSTIKSASYVVNGRDSISIRSTDEIFDSPSESFSILVPSGIFLQFQIIDAAGNASYKGLYIP